MKKITTDHADKARTGRRISTAKSKKSNKYKKYEGKEEALHSSFFNTSLISLKDKNKKEKRGTSYPA
jgi:hypothetical protein